MPRSTSSAFADDVVGRRIDLDNGTGYARLTRVEEAVVVHVLPDHAAHAYRQQTPTSSGSKRNGRTRGIRRLVSRSPRERVGPGMSERPSGRRMSVERNLTRQWCSVCGPEWRIVGTQIERTAHVLSTERGKNVMLFRQLHCAWLLQACQRKWARDVQSRGLVHFSAEKALQWPSIAARKHGPVPWRLQMEYLRQL